MVKGPSSLEGWLACWEVFSTAMVMCVAADMASLKSYAEGIKDQYIAYGTWGVLFQADTRMRCTEWQRIRLEWLREPIAGFVAARPWNSILKQTSFGMVTGPRQYWWWKNVAPTQKHAGSSTVAGAEDCRHGAARRGPLGSQGAVPCRPS